MSALADHVDKLGAVADGALRRIDERRLTMEQESKYAEAERMLKYWWMGYRRALDEVVEFVSEARIHPDGRTSTS
jgi:hypothetical protein